MKKLVTKAVAYTAAFLLFTACGDGNLAGSSKLQDTIDSLKSVNQQQQADLQDMTDFISTLSEGMNAIAVQENMLLSSNGAEGVSLDREQLKSHLATFANTLAEQRKKINALTDSLKARGTDMSQMQGIIDNLQRQIDEKDKVIAQLQKDINEKNISINDLQRRLTAASAGKEELQQKAATAERELAKHTTAYVLIGTKDALMEGGYIDKRSRLITENTPMKDFTKVNIYKFTEQDIPSRSVKLLTAHDRKSYTIEKVDKENRRLVITNPDLFWATSKYLVILIK